MVIFTLTARFGGVSTVSSTGFPGETHSLPEASSSRTDFLTGATPLGRLTTTRDWLPTSFRQFVGIDPEVLRYGARVSLWARWFVWLAILAHLAYRPETWFPHKWYFLLAHVPLVMCNGLFHYWLLSKRPVTWHWLLAFSAMDIALITTGLVMKGEFGPIFHLGYYPALALVAVVVSSLRFTLVWTTMVAGLYTVVSLTQGLDLATVDDKTLIARVGAMYAVVAIVGLIVRFERRRRQETQRRAGDRGVTDDPRHRRPDRLHGRSRSRPGEEAGRRVE